MNGELKGTIMAEVSSLKYRIGLYEDDELVDEKSGLVTSWLDGKSQSVQLSSDYFTATVTFTPQAASAWWTFPPEKRKKR
jgi:hypothetical protein